LASIVAIGVMGLLAYLFFASIASFADVVPLATLIATVVCAAAAVYIWQPEESDELSTREWVHLTLGFWAAAAALFAVACWLANIPFDEALTLPRALWQRRSSGLLDAANWADRLFWWAMALGPGVALIAIGSVVRGLVLWMSGRAESTPRPHRSRGSAWTSNMDAPRRGTKIFEVLSWTLIVLIVSLSAFFVLGPLLRNPTVDAILSYWHERYLPATILALTFALGIVFRWVWRDFRETHDPWTLLRLSAYLLFAIVLLVFLSWQMIFAMA
jgi:hypothetical protein